MNEQLRPIADNLHNLYFQGAAYFAKARTESTGDKVKLAYHPVEKVPTVEDVMVHLNGGPPIGDYTVRKDNTVRYILWDVDSKKDLQLARNLTEAICEQLGDLPYYAFYSGNKGYHIVLFLAQPIPAKVAREFGILVRTKAEAPVSGDPHVEVYPKQDELVDSQPMGNLIKLPGCIHPISQKRSVGIHIGKWEEDENLPEIIEAGKRKTTLAQITAQAQRLESPIQQIIDTLDEIWVDGRRDSVGVPLAGYLAKAGWEEDQVQVLFEDLIGQKGGDGKKFHQQIERVYKRLTDDLPVEGWQGLKTELQGEPAVLQRISSLVERNSKPDKAPGAGALGKATEMQEVLKAQGYKFTLNVLENYVYVNGQFLDDILASTIECRLVDLGLKNFALMDRVFNVMADQNRYHPVVDYFEGLTWDGKDHLQALMQCLKFQSRTITYADGHEADYASTMLHKWLLGLIAQVVESAKGEVIRFQNPMLVLSGLQGAGKSTFARWLCPGGDDYHNEDSIEPDNVEHQRLAVSKVIWEVTELSATMRKSDKDALKAFLTKTKSTYRPPWGKRPITKPRMCSYIGTVNPEGGFLSDVTGERRYLPIEINSIDWGYTNLNVDQLWAQLYRQYRSGASPILTVEERRVVATVHTDHKVDNPLIPVFERVFEIDPERKDWKMFTADIVTAFNESPLTKPGMLDAAYLRATKQVSETLLSMGLEAPKTMKKDGTGGKGYCGIKPKPHDYTGRRVLVI